MNCKKQPKKDPIKCFIDKIYEYSNRPVISVIKLKGIIGCSNSARSGLSLDSLDEEITKAFNVKRLKAVILCVNSPGGSPVQSELIYKRIRSLSVEKNIPVISFAEDVAASGGYWLLCAADEIYASANSIIGSVGVISSSFGFQELIKKIGIERRVYAEGKNKSVLDPFLDTKETDINIIKRIQKDIHESFKELVIERRKEKLKEDHDYLFNGEFWSGKESKRLGLIDDIGDMHSFIDDRFGKDVKIKRFCRPMSWLKRKFGIGHNQEDLLDYFIYRLVTYFNLNKYII